MSKHTIWESRREQLCAIKSQNVKTLATLWPSLEAVETEESNWGDEVEYLVVRLDHETRELDLSLRASQILNDLRVQHPEDCFDAEAYKYMLESQPRRPYGNSLQDLCQVEIDMRDRRRKILNFLSKDERVLTLTNVAWLGSSRMKMDCKSLITDKQRYKDLMTRIPGRAGASNDNYSLELQSFFVSPDYKGPPVVVSDPIDGFGGCGLQATFSANNMQQACRLHDQLIPLGPLMLALSAATPIYKGRLVATDTRWEAMCMAGDDRKSSEKPKVRPRLGCTPMYLEENPSARQLNDRILESAEETELTLHEHGLPPTLATYFTHILHRDPLMEGPLMPDADDMSRPAQDARAELMNLHMSTWWPHVRLKLPVLSGVDTSLPWRVEFRPMEVQPSDMENAALVIAMRILQQTTQHFDLDLRIPISAVEGNMNRASDQSAATDQVFRFFARLGFSAEGKPVAFDGWASLDVIFNGGDDNADQKWMGLLPLAKDFLAAHGISKLACVEQEKIFGALELLSARANGRLDTPAKWMRTFVKENSHGDLRDEELSSRLYYAMALALSN